YWVSQGNKWCDFCKIYIANNPLSIRTRELGQRHKDNQRRATRTIWLLSRERIPVMDCNLIRKLQMKPSVQLRLEMVKRQIFFSNYSPKLRKPTCILLLPQNLICIPCQQSLALVKLSFLHSPYHSLQLHTDSEYHLLADSALYEDGAAPKPIVGRAPGLVISTPLNPMRAVKGAQSSVAVKRTKRVGEKAKVISEEEAEALKAREAAGKRMEEGEKPLTGLYKSFCEAKPDSASFVAWNVRAATVLMGQQCFHRHMKLATQEFCISPQSAVPQSKSRSYVWTMFETSTTWLLFHRFPQFLPADPTALSVPEGGRQRNPLSISSYRLQAEPPKHNPVTLQHHAQNRGGRRRGAPPFSIDLVSSIVPTTHVWSFDTPTILGHPTCSHKLWSADDVLVIGIGFRNHPPDGEQLYQFALFGVGSFDMEITRLFDAFMWLDTAFSHVFDLCELHTKTYGSTIPL
ncbi:U1 zinc finger, partial [Musa troglodytarum]